jgi:hypothetical protein
MFISVIKYPKTAKLHKYVSKNVWANDFIEFKCSELTQKTTTTYNPLDGLRAQEEVFTIETPVTIDYKPNDRIVFEGKLYTIENVSFREIYEQSNHKFKSANLRVYELRLKRG